MKRLFFLIIILLGLTPQVIGQIHFADVLKAVEENSPVLKSARVQSEAAQSAVHVGLLLPNPTVEAGYFFPSPNELGVRWDLRASQSFEFPTVIAHRAHLRDLQEQAAAIGYQRGGLPSCRPLSKTLPVWRVLGVRVQPGTDVSGRCSGPGFSLRSSIRPCDP